VIHNAPLATRLGLEGVRQVVLLLGLAFLCLLCLGRVARLVVVVTAVGEGVLRLQLAAAVDERAVGGGLLTLAVILGVFQPRLPPARLATLCRLAAPCLAGKLGLLGLLGLLSGARGGGGRRLVLAARALPRRRSLESEREKERLVSGDGHMRHVATCAGHGTPSSERTEVQP